MKPADEARISGYHAHVYFDAATHRAGLVVFVHPVTGNELADHRDHAIWLGTSRPLDRTIFADEAAPMGDD